MSSAVLKRLISILGEAVLTLCGIAVLITILASYPLNVNMASHVTTPKYPWAFLPIPKGRGGRQLIVLPVVENYKAKKSPKFTVLKFCEFPT